MSRILRLYILFSSLVSITLQNNTIPQPDDMYLKRKFIEAELVPEVIPEAPKQLCHAIHEIHGKLFPGDELYPKMTNYPPNITWDDADPNSLYCIYMAGKTNWTLWVTPLDPKESLSPEHIAHEYHQWIVINIPGNDVSQGEVLYPYMPPGNPIMDYVKDRYAFLIYKQAGRIIKPKPKYYDWYMFQEFSPTVKFVRDYNLTGPIAGNFFYTTG